MPSGSCFQFSHSMPALLHSQNLNSFLFGEFFPGPLVIRELPSKVFWCQIQSLHLVLSCLISLTSQVFLFLHQVEDSWRMNNWKLSPGHNGIRMKLVSMTYPFCEIPAPPDSSKLVPLRVRPDFLLCVPRSVGAAVRGPRSFFPPAMTVAAAPRGTRGPCWVHASCQLWSATLPGRPPKQAFSLTSWADVGPCPPCPGLCATKEIWRGRVVVTHTCAV